jgi:uncharacterized membrane protein HdeD (DUF308 family)
MVLMRFTFPENDTMATNFPYFLAQEKEPLPNLRRRWGWFLALGIFLIVVGVLAIQRPVVATLTVVEVLGFLLVFGAGAEIVSSFFARCWGGFFLHLLTGLLYLFIGAVLLEKPGLAAAGYTLMLAVFFVASGLFRVAVALSQRFSGWGWTLLSGVVTLALGVLIWRDLPEAAFWVIGTFFGIDLLFIGWSWIMLGLAVRSIPKQEQTKEEPAPAVPV